MRTAFKTIAGRARRATAHLRAGRSGQAPHYASFWSRAMLRLGEFTPRLRRHSAGQAMTEVVLLFPMFLVIVFLTAKVFALLVLVQKMEIASYYAARRWQLESHLNAEYAGWDETTLKKDIEKAVKGYIGFDTPAVSKFLNLKELKIEIVRTQVWNVITINVTTNPAGVKMLCKYPKQAVCTAPYGLACMNGHDYLCQGGKSLEVIKYVPNRDRPINFVLPGLK